VEADADEWYAAYFEILNNVGLLVEEQTFRTSDTGTIEADVEKVVLELAASLLGGVATTAFKVVEATLAALQRLQADSPAVAIFRRETQRESARFQLSVVDEVDGRLAVHLLAFTLDLSTTGTQVLFFKARAESARLRHQSADLTVVRSVLDVVARDIADRVADRAATFVKQLAI
jgi:hypothetical protein